MSTSLRNLCEDLLLGCGIGMGKRRGKGRGWEWMDSALVLTCADLIRMVGMCPLVRTKLPRLSPGTGGRGL